MPHEDVRSLIRIGKTSFAIVIPAAWLRYYGLTARDKLKVISNGNITIKAPKKRKDSSVNM